MKKLLFLHPDPPPGGGGTPPPTPPQGKGYTPQADTDLRDVALALNEKWATTPLITMDWKTQPDFAILAGNFKDFLKTRITTGSTRPVQTKILENLDIEINASEEEVKAYCNDKYGAKNGQSYFPQFGIVHKSDGWSLPADRNERNTALVDQMIPAILANGFGAKAKGTAYWVDIASRYNNAFDAAATIDGIVTGAVGPKNAYAIEIRKVLKCMRLILHGNFPDTYHNVWREYGMQREDY